MQITLEIPDGQANDIMDGVCAATGWTDASGVLREQWLKDALVKYIKDNAKRGQIKKSMANIAATIDPVNIR